MTQRSGLFVPAALAALFVVPAVALQDAPAGSLAESLRRTVLALETLTGLGERIELGEREAVGQVLQATEPALDQEQEPGPLLAQLRGEVAALEIELDALHAATPEAAAGHTGARPTDAGRTPLPPTTGLDDEARALLGALSPGSSSPAPGLPVRPGDGEPAAPGAGRGAAARRSFEESGYAADALRLARAYYRKGRWDEARALLEGRTADPESAYWHARCLDKLGRFDEAVGAYEALVADPQGGEHAQRAREDLEFLRWRREFEARQEAARAGTGDGEQGR